MQIVDMVGGTFSGVVTKQTKDKQNSGFDMLLAEAGKRQQSEPVVEKQSKSRDENRDKTSEVKEPARPKGFEKRENPSSKKAEATEAVDTTPQANELTEQQVAVAQTNEQNETEATGCEVLIIAKIAEIMGVTEEVVMAWLEETGLNPNDLTEPKAVVNLLQNALEAENPEKLLNDPTFAEKYKAINETMSEVATTVNNAEKGEKTVKLSEEAVELADELEVALEDGKMVVKGKESLRSSAQSNQQAETQADTQTETKAETSVEVKDEGLNTADKAVINEAPVAVSTDTAVAARVEQAVSRPVPQQPVDTANVIEQIMNQVKLTNAGSNFTEIRLTLRPETLGDIILRVITQNGIVMAQFEAENQRVKEALESSMNLLRDSLEEAGVKFSELSVSVRQDNADERMKQFEKARLASRGRAESIEDISEEVEVSYHNGVIDVTA